ncbi:hypothetical protein CDD83_828 [Cordyceps sp. RAO-2017]|nr:hypothetical protein CDD83_828 [Cordyceps sp. RAO-2017]
MASRDHHGGRLDASAGRAVVYCHACSHEWYRDEHGLTCPDCESDITEIVNPENDPREPNLSRSILSSPALESTRYEDENDDPEEADIDEFAGPHGFIHRRSVRGGSEHAEHHNPAVEPVLNRFYEMLQDFGPTRNITGRDAPTQDDDGVRGWPRIHRATFTPGPFGGGTASVTIFSGPPPGRLQMGQAHNGHHPDPFQAIFTSMLRDLGPPQSDQQGTQPPQLARGLQEILSLFSPANAMAGDVVYSQEALDRIITQLMEANPQSNAAPPASDEAIKTLDRRTVDTDMLKGESKTECTICIDEMGIGDKAVVLPCRHWFHEECVILWLKEHNTCPICRTSIEPTGGSQPGGSHGDDGAPDSSEPRPAPFHRGHSTSGGGENDSGASRIPRGGLAGNLGWSFSRQGGGAAESPAAQMSEPSWGPVPSRLDSAFRAVSTIREERERERGRGTPQQQSYDTSRLQRRPSISPSPRGATAGDYGNRMRQRSPSENNRRGQQDRGLNRQSGQGPLNWLRERFTGGGGSHQAWSRGERRN